MKSSLGLFMMQREREKDAEQEREGASSSSPLLPPSLRLSVVPSLVPRGEGVSVEDRLRSSESAEQDEDDDHDDHQHTNSAPLSSTAGHVRDLLHLLEDRVHPGSCLVHLISKLS